MTRLVVAKQAADLCTGAFNQHVLYECLQGGLVEKHLGLLRQEYRKQRDAMLDCIRHHFGDQGQVQCPGGGMFVWLTLPPRVSGTALLERTLPRGVVFAPGASFFAEAKPDNTARLSFTHANFEQMETGIAILAEECRKLAHCHGARIG